MGSVEQFAYKWFGLSLVPRKRNKADTLYGTEMPSYNDLRGRSFNLKNRVTRSTALSLSPVQISINAVADTISRVPVTVEAGTQEIPDHPVQLMLTRLFRSAMTRKLNVDGNAYGLVYMVSDGTIRTEVLTVSGNVTIDRDRYDFENVKRPGGRFERRSFPAANILHLIRHSEDGVFGISPVAEAQEMISWALAMQRGAIISAQDGRPNTVVSFPNAASSDEMAEARESYFAADPSFIALPGDAKVQRLGLSPNEGQHLETNRSLSHNIMGIWGVPALFSNDLSDASYSNASMQIAMYIARGVEPVVAAWREGVKKFLLPGQDTLWDTGEVEIAIPLENAKIVSILTNSQIMTQDEGRAKVRLRAEPRGEFVERRPAGNPATREENTPSARN